MEKDRVAEILIEIARRLTANTEEFALLDCLNTGRPIREFLGFDIPLAFFPHELCA